MATAIANSDPELNDADYKSSEDSDFDPTANGGADNDAASSASEAEDADSASKPTIAKRGTKRKGENEAEDLGFENSGDEATIRRGKKKKKQKGDEEVDDEEGGEGGVVKTRSMRAVEEKEKKPLASAVGATVDVDALWKNLNSASTMSESTSTQTIEDSALPGEADMPAEKRRINSGDPSIQGTRRSTVAPKISAAADTSDMIAIKRTYIFAGETITEEKLVPATSAEARLHLQSQSSTLPSPTPNASSKPLRRPKKRVSQFEPNPSGIVKGLPPPGPKLNTIEKSKLDWAGYVDKAGIKEELDVAEKAKEGYLGRMDFLGRMEAKKEDERKNAKLK